MKESTKPACVMVVLSAWALAVPAQADDPPQKPDAGGLPAPVQMTAQQDHKRMMELLNIKELRRGANGNDRSAPNAANYDESKANPYSKLPDPLVLKNGQKVTTAEMWYTQRRAEIVEDFDREIYGRVPKESPKVKWEVTATDKQTVGDVPVVTKRLVGHVDNSSYPHVTVGIQLSLTTPASAKGPVPVIMEFGFSGFGLRRAVGVGAPTKAGVETKKTSEAESGPPPFYESTSSVKRERAVAAP